MKILNLYAGIGGNRKLWGSEHDITAVEYDEVTADVYSDYFPNDNIVIDDAHEYLINNFKDFDFIWSSPPCPTHSKINTFAVSNGIRNLEYPDMRLYQEILLLKHWYKGKYVVENVQSYYEPLIRPQALHRHYFWANFIITEYEIKNIKKPHKEADEKYLQEFLGYNLKGYKLKNKRQNLRNCVLPEVGKHILNCAIGNIKREAKNQNYLF